eukprot:TRINITY_DN6330_c0_g1_i1.p1 TRINITY_DN6330_c0_g1~~TRINITY_DN6330_c0_g1_i1.p1  ORF type:complete len:225 (+),score=22.03 TRINITY_DN6330_c0_g1_i1:513-1187(+)
MLEIFVRGYDRSNSNLLCKIFNEFLGRLPHAHKIVIGGNHEIAFNKHNKDEIQSLLSNCTYLQDSAVTIEGIKFFGSPWTLSHKMGFSCSWEQLGFKWRCIPFDTDILITHCPPFNILDLAFQKNIHGADAKRCNVCQDRHPKMRHWGDKRLFDRVNKVRPLAHIFGHVHDAPGFKMRSSVLFVNAAMDLEPKATYFSIINYWKTCKFIGDRKSRKKRRALVAE